MRSARYTLRHCVEANHEAEAPQEEEGQPRQEAELRQGLSLSALAFEALCPVNRRP
jgi:hypothetical protein